MTFSTTTNMGLSVPSSGTTVADNWVTSVNGWATTIDSHDHTTGKGVRIPPAGLNITSDLEFNGNAATELEGTFYSDQSSDPSTTKAIYTKSGELYFRDGSGNNIQITTSGALNVSLGATGLTGATGITWFTDEADAPLQETENNFNVYRFMAATTQNIRSAIKVPQDYQSGDQILLYIGEYSPSNSNTILLSAQTTLIRKNQDAITSTTNQRTSTNTALTNTVANQLRETSLDLTDGSGQINSVFVNPGDTLLVRLFRGTDTDTADIRFLPSNSEAKFA